MASNSYLDNTGVLHLWGKIKSYIANESEKYAGNISGDQNINVGVVPTEDGPKNYSLSLAVSSAGASLFPGDTNVTIATIGATPIKLSLDSIGYYNAFRVSGSSGVELYTADEPGGNRFNILAGNGIDIRDCGLNEDGIYIDSTYTAGTGLTLSGTQFSVSSANASTIMNLLTTGSSTPKDDDYYISQYVNGGTSTTTYHRRPHSALWSYIKGKANSTYVNVAGDTMTGDLIISSHNALVKCTGVTINNSSNNGVTSNVYGQYKVIDNNNYSFNNMIGAAYTDGRVRWYTQLINKKTDSTEVSCQFGMYLDKSGNQTFTMTSPAAFRTALELGSAATHNVSVIEDNSSGTVSVAKNTWKTMNTITLTKGFYVIQLYAEWSSAKGYSRQIILSTSKNSGSALGYRFKDFRSLYNNTSQCMNNVCFPLYVSSTTATYFVNVNHKSDSAVNCITRVAYFKLT